MCKIIAVLIRHCVTKDTMVTLDTSECVCERLQATVMVHVGILWPNTCGYQATIEHLVTWLLPRVPGRVWLPWRAPFLASPIGPLYTITKSELFCHG